MAVNLTTFIEQMRSGDRSVTSKFGIRDPKKQARSALNRFPYWKKELGRTGRMLIPTTLYIPFDALTGESTEYSKSNPFIPTGSYTSCVLALKKVADETPKVKELFLRHAGKSSWDTSDSDTVTPEDKEIFLPYRGARPFSQTIVSVNLQLFGAYANRYSVTPNRDPDTLNMLPIANGRYQLWYEANRLYSQMVQPQIDAIRKEHEDKKIKEDEMTTKITAVRQSIPVSSDRPYNSYVVCILPENSNMDISSDINLMDLTSDKLSAFLYIMDESSKMRESMAQFKFGEKMDRFLDFVEFQVICPQSKEYSGNPQLIGLHTTYSVAPLEYSLLSADDDAGKAKCAKLQEVFREWLDSAVDLEREMLRSMRCTPFETISDEFVTALAMEMDIDDERLTKRVLQGNKALLRDIFADGLDERLLFLDESEDDDAVEEANRAAAEGKKYDISELTREDDEGSSDEDAGGEGSDTVVASEEETAAEDVFKTEG